MQSVGLTCPVVGVLTALLVCVPASAAVLPASSFVFDGQVNDIVRSGDDVYVAGSFTKQQEPTGGGLILDQGGSGEPDTSDFPQVAGTVSAVAPDGAGGWYIGGSFTHVSGQPRSGLAHILSNGTLDLAWNPNPNGNVGEIAASGATVYVGGTFSQVGGQSRENLAALDAVTGNATAWSPNPDGFVGAVAASESTIYVAGGFSQVGGQLDAATGNTTAWNPAPNGVVDALGVSASAVYAGGSFSQVGGQSREGLAALDAATGNATAWNPNPNFGVSALATFGATVYVGGQFSAAGTPVSSIRGIAKLSATGDLDTAWNPDANGSVSALTLSGSAIYAGGGFSSIGGQTRNGLAAFDVHTGAVTSWNPNLSGFGSLGGSVRALAVFGSTIYVGGSFFAIGGQTRYHLAAFDTSGNLSSWNPNPNPPSTIGSVSTIVASGSTVYAGGFFSSMGNQTRFNLAAVDVASGNATTWNPNPNFPVSTLALSGATLYVGGSFKLIAGQSRSNLVAFDVATGNITAWDPNPNQGEAFASAVEALAISGSTIYAGGSFSQVGGQPRRNLAALDESGDATSWNPPTPDDTVNTVAVSGSTIYAGGFFSSVDGLVTGPFAVLSTDIAPPGDTTPPSITITTPTEGQRFTQGQSVTSAFTCNDNLGGSGVQSCSGPATVATSTVGARQFTVTASDQAGNMASKTVNYVVDSPPVSPSPSPAPPPPGPPPPGPPPGGTGTVDRTPPTARLSGATVQKLVTTISVTIACTNEPCTARATGTVRTPRIGRTNARTHNLRAVTRRIGKGSRATVRLTLTPIARTAITRALRARQRITVRVRVVVTDAAGNRRTLTRQVRLRR